MIYVLAGVNGGGKSSLGGAVLREAGMAWFNPRTTGRARCRPPAAAANRPTRMHGKKANAA